MSRALAYGPVGSRALSFVLSPHVPHAPHTSHLSPSTFTILTLPPLLAVLSSRRATPRNRPAHSCFHLRPSVSSSRGTLSLPLGSPPPVSPFLSNLRHSGALLSHTRRETFGHASADSHDRDIGSKVDVSDGVRIIFR